MDPSLLLLSARGSRCAGVNAVKTGVSAVKGLGRWCKCGQNGCGGQATVTLTGFFFLILFKKKGWGEYKTKANGKPRPTTKTKNGIERAFQREDDEAHVRRVWCEEEARVCGDVRAAVLTFLPRLCLDRPCLKVKDVALSLAQAKLLKWVKAEKTARVIVSGMDDLPRSISCMHLQLQGGKMVFLDCSERRPVPSAGSQARAMQAVAVESVEAEADENICAICMANSAHAKLAQCNHVGVRAVCALQLIWTTMRCPLCRADHPPRMCSSSHGWLWRLRWL
jgi:hypothetical protein